MTGDKWLERAANVSILACSMVLSPILTSKQSGSDHGEHGGQARRVDRCSALIAQARPLVDHCGPVAFLSLVCAFCKKSVGFYQASATRVTAADRSLLVAVRDSDTSGGAARVRETQPAGAVAISERTLALLDLRAPPTFVAYSAAGRGMGVWVGSLRSQHEAEVEFWVVVCPSMRLAAHDQLRKCAAPVDMCSKGFCDQTGAEARRFRGIS